MTHALCCFFSNAGRSHSGCPFRARRFLVNDVGIAVLVSSEVVGFSKDNWRCWGWGISRDKHLPNFRPRWQGKSRGLVCCVDFQTWYFPPSRLGERLPWKFCLKYASLVREKGLSRHQDHCHSFCTSLWPIQTAHLARLVASQHGVWVWRMPMPMGHTLLVWVDLQCR